MDVEILSRIQFALTISFHYIYPPLSIGLGLVLVIIEGIYLKTRNPLYKQMAKFWVKIFALIFSIGVATGIVMEFEFGTNWATYSRYVGDVFGSALGAEGIFAFFLESGFLALLIFGWDKVGPKTHFFSTLMVSLGSHFSAVWIVVANSWMQTPAGFEIVGEGLDAKAQIVDFWAMVFNPSSMERLAHVVVGAWISGAFLVVSVSAFYLLKNKFVDIAKPALKIGLAVATFAVLLQLVTADISARGVAKNQPAKMAALEGLYQTQANAPVYAFGVVDPKNQTVTGLPVPGMLSLLIAHDTSHVVPGLDQFPRENWPKVEWVFQTYHLMIAMWGIMFFAVVWAAFSWWRKSLYTNKWLLRLLMIGVIFPQIANQAGWYTAEMGRQPWIVYGLLRTSEGLSKVVSANQVLGSLIMFSVVYLFLFALFIYLLDHKIRNGPPDLATIESSSRSD